MVSAFEHGMFGDVKFAESGAWVWGACLCSGADEGARAEWGRPDAHKKAPPLGLKHAARERGL